MPTYEFRCANGHTFDQFHKISDAPSTATCPICGAEAERAISGGAGLVFKGSGFYLTDYGKNAHRSGGAAAKGDAKGEGGDAGGKGESAGAKDAAGSSGSSSPGGGTSGASSNTASGTSSGGTSSGGTSSGTSSGTSGGTSGGAA